MIRLRRARERATRFAVGLSCPPGYPETEAPHECGGKRRRCRATRSTTPKPSGSASGRTGAPSRRRTIRTGPSTTCSRCFPIRPAGFTWATCATTRSATWSRAKSAGICRAASDGLGCVRAAGGERRDGQGRASRRVDLRQHRGDAGAVPVHGPVARLVARGRDLSGVLSPRAGDVPRLPRGRTGLPQGVLGQLGPGRSDRARQSR